MTGVMTSLHTLSATTLSGMMARGDVSVVEVTDAFLARIAAHNDALQAFVHVAAFRARRRAGPSMPLVVEATSPRRRWRACPWASRTSTPCA